MAHRVAKLALANAEIPFVSTQLSRGALIPDMDVGQRLPKQFWGGEASYEFGTVQVTYAENVMPVAEGWKSVSYRYVFSSPTEDGATIRGSVSGTPTDFPAPTAGYYDCIELRHSDPNQIETAGGAALGAVMRDKDVSYLMLNSSTFTEFGDSTTAWYRLPISYGASGDWAPLSIWDATWAKLDWFSSRYTTNLTFEQYETVTTAIPAGYQFICMPRTGILFFGSIRESGADLDYTTGAVWQYGCTDQTGTLAAITADWKLYQFIENLPFNSTEVTCITGSQGYLIVASGNQVAWALASGNKFNFASYANNAVTGSDVRIPEELIGEITALAAVPGGFIIFSEQNAVAAFYSSTNFAVPWTFRKISGAGGVRSARSITKYDHQGAIYAMTSVGLQKILLNVAVDVDPAFNDYVSARRIDVRNEVTGHVEQAELSANLRTSCNLIGSRYLVVSCGTVQDTLSNFAWVYDLALKRWGKLDTQHTSVYQLQDSEESVDMTIADLGVDTLISDYGEATIDSFITDPVAILSHTRQKLGLLQVSGKTKQAVLGQGEDGDSSQALLQFSSLQFTRNRNMTLQMIDLDGVQSVEMSLYPSYDGRNIGSALSSDFWSHVETSGDFTRFGGMITAQSFTFQITGKFDLSTVLVRATSEGVQ